MRRSFSHGAVAPRPCIATGKGVGKKIDKVGFTPCGSILSFLGFVTASLCNILLEQETVQFGSDKFWGLQSKNLLLMRPLVLIHENL